VKALRLARSHVRGRAPAPVTDGITVDETLVAAAAQHLRQPSSGGWTVSPTGQGDWRVGTMRKTPAELVEMAERKGFNRLAVTVGLCRG